MTKTNHEHFLKRRRAELSISQGDLALRLKARGVPLSSKIIGQYERGIRQLPLDESMLKALADSLRWSLNELMGAIK